MVMRIRSVLVAVLVGAVALPCAAQSTLYKWVDERGVVNYGDTPPPNAKKTTRLDESTSSLSVVPGLSQEELARMRERSEQAKVERLEREVAELRERASTPPVPAREAPPPAYVPAYVPLVVNRRFPPRELHGPHGHVPPVRGAPVQRTPPFRSMELDQTAPR
jgi:hypothetical protein